MSSSSNYNDSGSTRVNPEIVQDFAFADTVVCGDLDEVVPPSGIVVSEEHQVTALDYPLDPAPYYQQHQQQHPHHAMPSEMLQQQQHYMPSVPQNAPFWDRVRFGMRRSREEIALLWSATASLEQMRDDGTIISSQQSVGRRVRTLWSFFEWDRTDLVRAAWIGLLVFVLVATIGAFALGSSSSAARSQSTTTPAPALQQHFETSATYSVR